MRLLLVSESAHSRTGGKNRLLSELIGALAGSQVEVFLAYSCGEEVTVSCPTRRVQSPADFQSCVAEIRPDVVQIHAHRLSNYLPPANPSFVPPGAPTCVFLHDQSPFCSGDDRMTSGCAACHRPHGPACLAWHYLQGCGGKHPLGNWTRWRRAQSNMESLANPAIRIQVASRFMLNGLQENGIRAERVDVLPLFTNDPGPPSAQPSGKQPLILAATRFVKAKGVGLLLRALAAIREETWRATIAGTGPTLAAARTEAAALGVSNRIQFPGELSPTELGCLYREAAFVVSPVLRPEPFGMVGIEAMAHGKAIITFTGGGESEWLEHGRTGLGLATRTSEALGDAMHELLRHPSRASEMGMLGRRAYERSFTPDKFVPAYLESLKKTIAGH